VYLVPGLKAALKKEDDHLLRCQELYSIHSLAKDGNLRTLIEKSPNE